MIRVVHYALTFSQTTMMIPFTLSKTFVSMMYGNLKSSVGETVNCKQEARNPDLYEVAFWGNSITVRPCLHAILCIDILFVILYCILSMINCSLALIIMFAMILKAIALADTI